MKTFLGILLTACFLFPLGLFGQGKIDGKEGEPSDRLAKTLGITDRTGGIHNKSNIAAFFENRGKLYARTLSQGVSGEFPIGSLHEYIYRVAPFVGIPGNVIQGRYTTNEEWEAVPGYANPDSARTAFSDKPITWPRSGWPVKDASGKPIFVSNQDSYCVYSDSNNNRKVLGIQVNQTGYAFSQKSVRDMIYFTFQITNNSTRTYDSVYFGLYGDIEPGGYSDANDYNYIRIVFDKKWNRIYATNTHARSVEWNSPIGVFGLMMLQTPKVNGAELGATDAHWCLYNDEKTDDDNIEFGRMASTQSLFQASVGSKFFHLGKNAPNMHFDDFDTQPAEGSSATSIMSSGPYRLAPGDTLKFVTAMVAGNTVAEMDSTTVHAYDLLAKNFVIVQPPASPKVTVAQGDTKATITWDNRSESGRDLLTGKLNFEGYRLFKSVDKGLHWDQIDRNLQPNLGADPVPLVSFDRVDGIGKDVGLQYSYVDTNVINGFEYWYTVTAYSLADAQGSILESSRGTTPEDMNLGVAIPRSLATGRLPVTASIPTHAGNGTANVLFSIQALDVSDAGGKSYTIGFAPVVRVEQGDLLTLTQVAVNANGSNSSDIFSLVFTSPTTYVLRDLTKGTIVNAAGSYASGGQILFEGLRLTLTDTSSVASERPEQGDSLVIRQGIMVKSGSTVLLPLQPFSYGTAYTTTSGVSLSIQPANALPQSKVTYDDSFTFFTSVAGAAQTVTGSDLDKIKVVPNPYLVSSLYEPEFGLLVREPVRVLRFNNLPAKCTIYIFNMAGDKVQTIEHSSDNGTETWDLRAAGGREIAPGVYIYLVKTDTAEKIGRFAVIK
jgi:hypothetical protein